jgi:hypothetical protein
MHPVPTPPQLRPLAATLALAGVLAGMLDPLLQDNGGLTPAHALLPGSTAIDSGSNPLSVCCDQRLRRPGSDSPFERVIGEAADIGAYEVGAGHRLFADGFEVPT